jgi:hypothetical protein
MSFERQSRQPSVIGHPKKFSMSHEQIFHLHPRRNARRLADHPEHDANDLPLHWPLLPDRIRDRTDAALVHRFQPVHQVPPVWPAAEVVVQVCRSDLVGQHELLEVVLDYRVPVVDVGGDLVLDVEEPESFVADLLASFQERWLVG